MAKFITMFLFFLVFLATASTFHAEDCQYEMVVYTGALRGPTNQTGVYLTYPIGDGSVNRLNIFNLVKDWGAMGPRHTYFLPYSVAKFRNRQACVPANFCGIIVYRMKLDPPIKWSVRNISVTTEGDGIKWKQVFQVNKVVEPYINVEDCKK